MFVAGDTVTYIGSPGLGLRPRSPALNAGSNEWLPPGLDTDLTGKPRIRNGVVDMGAFENQESPDPVLVESFAVTAEPGGIAIAVRLADVIQGVRGFAYRGATAALAGRALLAETELAPGSAAFDVEDTTATPGDTLWYSVEFVGLDRGMVRLGPLAAIPLADLPVRTLFFPAAPNPFSAETAIRFAIGEVEAGRGTLEVRAALFNVAGRKVRDLLAARLGAGEYQVTWDGNDLRGTPARVGVYYLRLRVGKVERTVPLVRIR